LRVGYVSPDFIDHVVGRNLLPLFRCHEPKNVEIFCYAGVALPDAFTERFRRWSHHWRSTVGVPDAVLAERIREDGVDILVDLAQHTAGNRLAVFARKPAPLQVSFAGYPESTGLDGIEYRISDRYLEGDASEIADRSSQIGEGVAPALRIPHSELRIPEQVLLIDSFWCYEPDGTEIAVNELPAIQRGQMTFGSLNTFSKINEPVLHLWARVLGQVKASRLILLSRSGSHRQRVRDLFEREGIAGDRVEFLDRRPRLSYLELYHALDIALDPFPYGGHTTSLDALWMGVPVVSLAGNTPVSRGGLSILSNAGLPELAAHSEDAYVRIATELAHDQRRLADLRTTLRSRMETSVLMDARHFARQIEAAYRAIWREWCLKRSDPS
jgi:predicted O-linked N-acetylglucosamine transferase (SPINDLY family)